MTEDYIRDDITLEHQLVLRNCQPPRHQNPECFTPIAPRAELLQCVPPCSTTPPRPKLRP